MNRKVLVVATSHKTKGGITSVVKSHQEGKQWKDFHCRWIETHIDRGFWWKLFYGLRAYTEFFFLIPFYNVAHFHISEIRTIQRKYPLFVLACLWHKKTIIHFHNNHFLLGASYRDKGMRLYRKVFCRADRIVVINHYWKDWLKDNFNLTDKVEVIYNSAPSVREPEKAPEREKSVLFAGVLTERKGCFELISAFADIASDFPDWKLILAGEGQGEKLRALANELGIAERVFFPGWVCGEEKDCLFRRASVFCLPSYAEGFPMVILEAWSYKLAVVTTRVGGIPDVVTDGENGILCEARNVVSLSAGLQALMRDEKMRQRLADHACQLVHTKYNRDMINQQLAELYSSI